MRKIFILILFFSFSQVFAIYPINENLDYVIRYGPLKGGKATIVTVKKENKGKMMIFTEMKLNSTGVANSIYTIDNTYSSFIDPETCLPEKSSFKLKQQEDEFEDDVTYFQDAGSLFSMQMGWDETKGEILDLVSLIYNLRFSDRLSKLKKGDLISVNFWDVDKIYNLKMKFCGDDEIKTEAGTFQCLKIEPVSESGSGMNKTTPISIWITNDNQMLPILIQFDLKIGSIKCELDHL
jgi:hypothetical protein